MLTIPAAMETCLFSNFHGHKYVTIWDVSLKIVASTCPPTRLVTFNVVANAPHHTVTLKFVTTRSP